MMNMNAGYIDAGRGDYAIRYTNTVRDISTPGGRGAGQAHSDGRPVSDNAHTSLLARMASRELQRLHEQDTIRPDKVAQFKHLASGDRAYSDTEIDTIMTRLLG